MTRARDNTAGAALLENAERAADAEIDSQIKYGTDLTRKCSRWDRLRWSHFTEDHELPRDVQREGMQKVSSFPTFAREAFTRLVTGDDVPKVDDVPAEGRTVRRMHALLDDLPEWSRLMERCAGDKYNAGLGASTVTGHVLEQTPQHEHDLRAARLRLASFLFDERTGREVDPEAKAQAQHDFDTAEREAQALLDGLDESAVRQALRAGIAEASETLDEIDNAMRALGCGSGQGMASPGATAELKQSLGNKLRNNPRLVEIMRLAGRFKTIAAEVRSEKIKRGAGELTDIEPGSALDRMLPSELAALTDPRRRLDFFRRWLEEQTLQYRLEDREPHGLGPIVVCVDDSGSMRGEPEVWAKSLALALLDVARKSKRAFAFCTYDTRLGVTIDAAHAKELSPTAVADALVVHSGGGTDWNPPLAWASEQIERDPTLRKADVIFVTDDQCTLQDSARDRINGWRERSGARVWGIAVGPKSIARRMSSFCDRVYELADLVVGSDGVNDDATLRSVLAI
jgi:uncharacterized protein with von Willebrand factor type A (vWA) domain